MGHFREGRIGRLSRLARFGLAVAIVAALAVGCAGETDLDSARQERLDVELVPGSSDRATSLIQLAETAAAKGDLQGAVQLYRKAYQADRENTVSLIGLGRTLAASGAHNEAAEAFRTAARIERDADDSDKNPVRLQNRLAAMQGLGNALIALDHPNEAISQFEASLELRERPRAYNGMGVAYDMLGDHKVAQAYYRTGLALNPRNLSLLNNLGLSLAIAGAFDEAISILRRAAVDPRAGSRQRLNLALAYGLAGKNEEAAEISRIDLDENAVRGNLAYYRTLRALSNKKATLDAIGAHGEFKIDNKYRRRTPNTARMPGAVPRGARRRY